MKKRIMILLLVSALLLCAGCAGKEEPEAVSTPEPTAAVTPEPTAAPETTPAPTEEPGRARHR